jgi:hypothetical protein
MWGTLSKPDELPQREFYREERKCGIDLESPFSIAFQV